VAAALVSVAAMTVRLGVIELVVADMAASLAFYRRLGLDVPVDADGEPHVEAVLPGGLKLSWDTEALVRSFDPDYRRGTGHGISLAFAADSPAEVDSWYEELTAAGYDSYREPWDAFWGMRYAVVRDPDGNNVDLYAVSS
jgi:catechol 2,3-dioxygenase-like lactoylglutathione lyase family enzyme